MIRGLVVAFACAGLVLSAPAAAFANTAASAAPQKTDPCLIFGSLLPFCDQGKPPPKECPEGTVGTWPNCECEPEAPYDNGNGGDYGSDDGYDSDGYDSDGYDSDGYDSDGYDSNGYGSNGDNSDGYGSNGDNSDGYNAP